MGDNSEERRDPAARNGKQKELVNKPAKSTSQPVGKKAAKSKSQPIKKSTKMSDRELLEDDIQHSVARPVDELQQHVNNMDHSWHTDPVLHDMLEGMSQEDHSNDPNFCTTEEIGYYRRQLLDLGPEEFYIRNVDSGLNTAKKLLTAFGARPPAFLEGHPAGDAAYTQYLILAMARELSKRPKLRQFNTVDDAVYLLKTCKNIVVLTGAGISTSLGIPDFRSAGTGLYAQLAHLGLTDPQEVFDISLFKDDPTVFFSVAKDILPDGKRFTPTHAFIAMLQNKGKLLTNYTQNIDNIEANAGVSRDKLIQCHGSFATATCICCGHQAPGESIFPDILKERIPSCPECAKGAKNTKRIANNSSSLPLPPTLKRKVLHNGTKKKPARRRADSDNYNDDSGVSDSEYDDPVRRIGGIMKPDITFFGEDLPSAFANRLTKHDQYKADLLVVIGTSLKVAPVAEVPAFLPRHIPQIVISREAVNHHMFDIDLLGDCDVVVAELARRAGWDLRHEMIPDDQEISVQLADGYQSRHIITSFSPSVEAAKKAKAAKEAKGNGEEKRTALGAITGNTAASANDDSDDSRAYASGSAPVVTTTRSGRRSGRIGPSE